MAKVQLSEDLNRMRSCFSDLWGMKHAKRGDGVKFELYASHNADGKRLYSYEEDAGPYVHVRIETLEVNIGNLEIAIDDINCVVSEFNGNVSEWEERLDKERRSIRAVGHFGFGK